MSNPIDYAGYAKTRLERALSHLDDTYPTKAARKDVLDDLNRAYEYARQHYGVLYRRVLFAKDDEAGGMDQWDRTGWLEERDVPFDLHNVRPRHIERIGEYSSEMADMVARLVELRVEVKDTPVVKPEPVNAAQREAEERIQRSIREEMDRLGKMYERALDVGRLFGGLNVSANVHVVTNQYGTTFLRAFYYLDGKRMPLGLIIAAADQLAREQA